MERINTNGKERSHGYKRYRKAVRGGAAVMKAEIVSSLLRIA